MTTAPIIVIGAGLGGLAAAMRLAHAGRSVVVCEAASVPGGKMRTLPSPAGPVDAGPTVLTLRWVFDALFADLGARLDDHVTLVPEPILARHYWPDGTCLDLHADAEASAEEIARVFSAADADAFRAFCARTRRLFDAFDGPVMRAPRPEPAGIARALLRDPSLVRAMAPWSSMAASLARTFGEPRLRQLFGRYATYVGGSPYAAPALLSLVWQAEASGVWRVEGGLFRLARAMADLAAAKGVEFRYDTPIRRIVPGQRSLAVIDARDQRHEAAAIVFNGDPRALVAGHLGSAVRGALPRPGVEPRSLSAEVWAFAARAEGRELAHHTVFFGADPHTEFDPIAAGEAPRDPTIYVCAQDRGAKCPPRAVERFEIIVNAAPDRPSREFATCHRETFQTLRERGLTFAPLPGPMALSTPAEFAALHPGSGGALYGRSPAGTMAAFRRPTARTAVPGLYLAGGGVHPGPGTPMATLSGKHAAEAILKDRISTSTFPPTATLGGTSTASRTTAPARSRSSGS